MFDIKYILESHIKENRISIPYPTDEQYKILDHIFNKTENVVVSSCPGSGKTTLIQYISLLQNSLYKHSSSNRTIGNSEQNILVLMYNKALSLESKKKFKKNKCNNIRCQTIHSFAYNNYKTKNRSYDDTLLIDILKENTLPVYEYEYTMIIIDEFQDATNILFKFVEKIIIDNKRDIIPQIIILGDPLQELYKFRGADSRFMLLSSKLFLGGRLSFTPLRMSFTNRCPQNICELINVCYYGENSKFKVMQSKKEGGEIRVCIGNINKIIIDELKLLKSKNVKFSIEDVMIIIPSLKNINTLKNTLSRNGMYIAVSDNENIDIKTTKNKILITTFHGSKGLERKICFVTSFSDDYYKYYATDMESDIISNTFYVALSRSSEYLFLIRNAKSQFPKWCPREYLENLKDRKIIKLYDEPLRIPNDIQQNEKECVINKINVTDLTKNLSNEFKQQFSKYVSFNILQKPSIMLRYEDVICTNRSTKQLEFYENGFQIFENISRFIGQAVTILFEFCLYNKQCKKNIIKNSKPTCLDNIDNKIKDMLEKYPEGNKYTKYYSKFLSNAQNSTTFLDIIYYCVLRESLITDDITLLNQIKYLYRIKDIFDIPFYDDDDGCVGENYDGSKLLTYLESVIDDSNQCFFEKYISCEYFQKEICGKLDIICDNSRIIEIKFKNNLDIEDYVQLFLYQAIMRKNCATHYNYEIYNAKTGEHYKMKNIDDEKNSQLIKLLLYPQKHTTTKLSDDEFVEYYKNIFYLINL